jgi:hypothetical protein
MPWKDRTFACGPTAVPEPPGRVAVLRGSGEARRGGPGFFSGSRCFELSLQYHTSAHPSSREKKSLANEAPAAGVTACWTLCFQRRSSPAPPVSCSQRAPGAREFLIGYSGVGRAPAAVSTHRSYASSFSAASSSKSDTQSCIAGMSSSTEGHSRCSVAAIGVCRRRAAARSGRGASTSAASTEASGLAKGTRTEPTPADAARTLPSTVQSLPSNLAGDTPARPG